MDITKFYKTVRKLKDVKRTGWIERGVKTPESVSDHSFMTAILCVALSAKGIDKEKAIKMALVHDLAESEIGDIITKESWTEGGTMAKDEKIKMERDAMKRLASCLSELESKEVFELWKEFEEEKSPEARFVKDVDRAETILQAYDYHSKNNFKKPLQPFWDKKGTDSIKDKRLKSLIKNIIDKGW
jgi:putative hydrolase of HD superfamily